MAKLKTQNSKSNQILSENPELKFGKLKLKSNAQKLKTQNENEGKRRINRVGVSEPDNGVFWDWDWAWIYDLGK